MKKKSKLSFFSKSTNEAQNYRIEEIKLQGIVEELISFQMQKKKRYVLALKLRPVKTFKGEKCNFTVEKIIAQPLSVTDGAIYDKGPLTTSAWYLSA